MSKPLVTPTEKTELFLDKAQIQQIVAEQNRLLKFVPDKNATPQKAREMMIAAGVNPEDNLGSCGIIAARDET